MSGSPRPVIEVLPTEVWAAHVAALLADRLAARPALVVCLPTGATPLPVYAVLRGELARRGVNATAATVVLLDEYLGLPAGHPARCDAVLRRTVTEPLGIGRSVSFEVDRLAPAAACRAYDGEIATLGGLDLVVLGLGRNGHVGMNEPGTAPQAPTRAVDLAPSTRAAAVAYGADPPPSRGLTLGMAGIMAAREVWLLATGSAKRAILGALLEAPPSSDLPASLLLGHPGLKIVADEAALSPRCG